MRIHRFFIFLILIIIQSQAGSVRFYGDLLLSRGIEDFVTDQGKDQISRALSLFLEHDAIQVVNLEGSMEDVNGRKDGHPLCFPIKPEMMDFLHGFHVVSLENNHSLDTGPLGLQSTMRTLKSMNIIALGGKRSSTVVVTDNGNIGIVTATDVLNNKADSGNVVIADSPEIGNEIRGLKENCTAVMVYVHWGRELFPIATARMKRLATGYINAGADLVVGTHPHVVGPVVSIQGKPVVYSLGNFLFDQKYADTKKGAILECEINDDGILNFKLAGCETSINSFLPSPSKSCAFNSENEILAGCSKAVKRTWTGIFTQDKKEKCLVLDSKKDVKGLCHLDLFDKASKKMETKTPPMPIRKLQPVDLNSDGINEIMLIQSMYSTFDKETAKRVYIYSFEAGFHALWRGTALSRPLIDAVFVSVKNGRPLLVALHSADSFLLRDSTCKRRIITVYKWNGFGFTGIKDIKAENECDGISYISGEVHIVKEGILKSVVSAKQLSPD